MGSNAHRLKSKTQGACHCKCTVGNKGEHRKLIDAYGIHLSTCPWGGWRICKHDRVNEQYGRFCQGAGNDVCWARVDKLVNALPSHAKDEGRARVHRIPDIVITDQLGNVTLTDTMLTLPNHSAKEPLDAARAAEKTKNDKYKKFNERCALENPRDPRLAREVVPIVFETYGAAGPATISHMALTRHQFGKLALPVDDQSSESTFFSTWSHQIATALQLGNAEAIHNIPRRIRSQARAPGDMVVEAVSLLDNSSNTEPEVAGPGASLSLVPSQALLKGGGPKHSS